MAIEASILISALAGLGSFLSPCILPIIPGFLSYLSSASIKEATNNDGDIHNVQGNNQVVFISKKARVNIFINTIYFVLGFSLVFSVLGVILNSVLATSIGTDFQQYLSYIGGIIIAAFGVNLILSLKITRLNIEKKFTKIPKFKTSYITSFVFGLAFAAGWTPCVGPILGSTFTLAAANPGAAYNLLLAYSLGLGIPFLITGAFFSQATGIIKKITKHLKYFNLIMGSILIVVGILIFFNQLFLLVNIPFVGQLVGNQG
ncbi:cytochrome c biogenesis CcdA family protein [Candidatus Nitrosocosmicus sp. FF01]|jgi:cytochrome c-type biogenesis protein|uniref:cytochrome c biogenesis CcdA family protein n=1 Tax=Candidatus Nitrosocosmicus sp. FF01 TaxID=3397670 RepID=UPI0039EA427F